MIQKNIQVRHKIIGVSSQKLRLYILFIPLKSEAMTWQAIF